MGSLSQKPTLNKGSIPAFLSIDVEPDSFQSNGAPPLWTGYEALFEFTEWLRSELTDRSDNLTKFGWYFRTDPQIADLFGRPDHALVKHPDRMARHKSNEDYLGVHTHYLRYSEKHKLWVHDFSDDAWLTYCVHFSLDAFEKWHGSPALRFRSGAGYLSNKVIETIDQHGVLVDLSLESVNHCDLIKTGVDESPVWGTLTDCRSAPLVPYHPSRRDFRIRGGRRGRGLVMIPLSSKFIPAEKPLWWRTASKLIRGSSGSWPEVQVLYPSAEWLRDGFWDTVMKQLQSMKHPYLSLAIRTDSADSSTLTQVRKIFAELPEHPIAEQLHFIDPLHVASSLA
jgi:hypothetical protein